MGKGKQMELPLGGSQEKKPTPKSAAFDPEVAVWIARLLPEAMTWDNDTATHIAQEAGKRVQSNQFKPFNIARMTVALERVYLLKGVQGGLEGANQGSFPELRFIKNTIRLRHLSNLL